MASTSTKKANLLLPISRLSFFSAIIIIAALTPLTMAQSHLRRAPSFIHRCHHHHVQRSASAVVGQGIISSSNCLDGEKRWPVLLDNQINEQPSVALYQFQRRSFSSEPLSLASTIGNKSSNIDASALNSSQKRDMSGSSKPQPPEEGQAGEKSMSNYERLVRKLYMTNLFNPVKLGLENMDRLHKVLGSPMDQVSKWKTCN